MVDENIENLKKLGFDKVKVIKTYDLLKEIESQKKCIKMNFTTEYVPTNPNLIIDVMDFYNQFIDTLKKFNISSAEEYNEKIEHTEIRFYIIVGQYSDINYSIYFNNPSIFSDNNYEFVAISFNDFFENIESPESNPILTNKRILTIKSFVNNTDVYRQHLTYRFSASRDENPINLIGDIAETKIPIVVEKVENENDIKFKCKKSYDYLLAYYIHNEMKNKNCDLLNNQNILYKFLE